MADLSHPPVEGAPKHSGAWNKTVRKMADERFELDLIRLCEANRGKRPVTHRHYGWTVEADRVGKCKEVAEAMRFGVSTVPMRSINYGLDDV